ncbi:hypothetical protein [Streptomyces sp. NPDC050560]|uniref:hypothetical protein n=1 Tax=Streptomyces sp. NPDC050560 TaxID=3365630 RepID=UPI0037A0FF68
MTRGLLTGTGADGPRTGRTGAGGHVGRSGRAAQGCRAREAVRAAVPPPCAGRPARERV